jgi:hypothetical protein
MAKAKPKGSDATRGKRRRGATSAVPSPDGGRLALPGKGRIGACAGVRAKWPAVRRFWTPNPPGYWEPGVAAPGSSCLVAALTLHIALTTHGRAPVGEAGAFGGVGPCSTMGPRVR